MTSWPLFWDIFILSRSGVANVAGIIKTVTMFIKKIFKDSKKLKKNYKLCTKMQSIFAFFDMAKFADFRWKNADDSRSEGVCQTIHIFFRSSLGKV